jgi:hypothetical protein
MQQKGGCAVVINCLMVPSHRAIELLWTPIVLPPNNFGVLYMCGTVLTVETRQKKKKKKD